MKYKQEITEWINKLTNPETLFMSVHFDTPPHNQTRTVRALSTDISTAVQKPDRSSLDKALRQTFHPARLSGIRQIWEYARTFPACMSERL